MAALGELRLSTPVGTVEVFRGGPPAGSASSIVYLHSAQNEAPGMVFLEMLAEWADTVAPVFPGFGQSEGIEHIDDMEDAVFHVVDVLDLLGLDAPTVVGLSLGGWLAVELATRYPDRVSKLVLVNPAGLYIPGSPIGEIFGRNLDDLARVLFFDQGHPVAQLMHQMASLSTSTLAGEVPFELVRPFVQSQATTAKLAWNPYLHNPKLPGRLHRVTAPTLVVHGVADGLIPRAHAETYEAAVPDARLVEVEDAAHMLPLEKPEVLAELVRNFVA